MSCPWQGRLTAEQAERGDSTVKNQYLALDYGGTFTKYAMMDREGRFLCEGKVPSACDSLEHMLACVAPLQEQFQGQYDGVAVSMPGRIDTARGVACTGGSFHFIRNTPIQHCLEKIFQAPVTVANDGKCAASAEAWSGALAGVEDGAVILLGTGTGGGLVLGAMCGWDAPLAQENSPFWARIWADCPRGWLRAALTGRPCGWTICLPQGYCVCMDGRKALPERCPIWTA